MIILKTIFYLASYISQLMISYLKSFVICFSLLCFLQAASQNIEIKTKSERIEIREDSTFVNQITVEFKPSKLQRLYPIIYDYELEQISDIQLFEKKKRRLKEIPVGNIEEEKVELDFINSKRIKAVLIPPDEEVVLKYIVFCKELMYFSSLHLFTYNQTDTIDYEVKVPKAFKFIHNTIYKDSLAYYKIDSTKTEQNNSWNIKVTPKHVKPDPLYLFGVYKNIKVPFMRTLVTPNNYQNKPENYMNDWYLHESSQSKGLNDAVKKKIDALTSKVSDPIEITKIIYNYIKTNFKYVAIEIGLGAFIPSHANEVYANKQGDCKDLSNLLTEALNYKGIRSDIALAATFDHVSDCDFPSLSSANHVISVAYIEDKIYLLDPTDFIHQLGTPVQSLQDRTIFIVNQEGGNFYEVNSFSPEVNEINYNIKLNVEKESKSMKGNFSVEYKGISSNYLRRVNANLSKDEFSDFSVSFFSEVFGDQTISFLQQASKSDTLIFEGDLIINGKTFGDDSNQYLFIDFLPDLFETESRESLLEGTYIGYPFSKKVNVKVILNSPALPFETIKHAFKEKEASLDFELNFISENTIEIEYYFVFDYIFTTKENVDITNSIIKSFKKIINEPIALDKQKN
jgi:hypothetical protein